MPHHVPYERKAILDQLKLIVVERVLMENRAVPLEITSTGRMNKALLEVRSSISYTIYGLYYDDKCILTGPYLGHFIEILEAFLHNQLTYENPYFLFNETHRRGAKLFFKKCNQPLLTLEVFDATTNQFSISRAFSKVECRIIIKQLNQYIKKGEFYEYPPSTMVCNFGNISFKEEQ